MTNDFVTFIQSFIKEEFEIIKGLERQILRYRFPYESNRSYRNRMNKLTLKLIIRKWQKSQ